MKCALLISVLLLAGVAGAHADYIHTSYHDNIRPNGRPRSAAIGMAAASACYAEAGLNPTLAATPAVKQCMLKRGYSWQSQRLVVTEPAPKSPGAGLAGVYTYNDALGRAAGESAEQAATRACDGGAPARIGGAAFNACMAARGWRFASFAPAPHYEESSPAAAADNSPPSVDIPDIGAMERNQQLMDDAATAASQAQLNATP